MNGRVDRAELISKLKTLAGLTDEERSRLIGLLREHKKYGLVWEDKPEDAEQLLEEQLPVLREVAEKRIPSLPSPNKTFPNHILIEGDNLHALTALSYTHAGKIDVIYIDPPYNTGNKDFAYYDDFNDDYRKIPYVEREDAYRHSKWLSFMKRRLKIAKKLLSDKGVIFISIDDNELAQLKLLCDEIFGIGNFVTKFDWRKKTGANDAKDIAVVTESILLYCKNHLFTIENNLWQRDEDSINQERYKYEDEFVNTRGKFYYDTLDRGGLQYSDSMNYGIETPDGSLIFPNGRDSFVNDGWIWKWGREKVKWGIENKFLEFVKSKKSKGSNYTIKYKVYQYVDNEGNLRKKAGRAYMNLITEPINQIGNLEMKELFDNNMPFSNPKPLGLIRYLLKTINCNNSTILDFFAGSGTTLHATMQLNAEDGGHRQCILVTNNENNICEEVTYVRNKKVIEGYTTPKGVAVAGLKENNLRYYKTDFIPRDRTVKNMRRLVEAATDMLCIKENIYQEQKAFATLPYNNNVYRYYEENGHNMLIIYQEEFIPVIVEAIKAVPREKWEKTLKVYVFSPDRDPYADEFFEVEDRVELCALPAAIYDAYTQVLPRWKDKAIEVNEEQVATEEDEWEV